MGCLTLPKLVQRCRFLRGEYHRNGTVPPWRGVRATVERFKRDVLGAWLGALTVVFALCAAAAAADAAVALSLSPLNGTPDASPRTQISFLGVPANQIRQVSVVGSRSGRHSGRLESYASAPGASFVLTHPFAQGERVTASALVGPGHGQRVSTTFTVAVPSGFRPSQGGGKKLTSPGLVQRFVSEPALEPPSVFVSSDTQQASPGDVFFTPTAGYGQAGTMIVNGQGGLVWFKPVPVGDDAADFQAQSYGGQPVLTWWQGHILGELGIGQGIDEIYSSSYQPIATVSAGNGYSVDLHEFQLTPQGSAFVTAYSLVDANLSSLGGSAQGTLQDAILQEIDVRTGLVMFEWHAYGHVALSDSYTSPSPSGAPWDFFHINSVSLDPWGDGNFIVSSRNTWAAYEINHVSGAVEWRIGGRRPSFRMGAGTGFAWQHDVRWQPDDTLTLFDDGATPKEHSQSRAIRERINWAHHSVELVGRDVRDPGILTGSQGNDQLLGDGDSFVGWGEEPYFTEFSPSGQTVWEAHFPSPGQSYRAFRFPWSAMPAAPPAVAVKVGEASAVTVYASWNGATDVSSWTVLAGESPSSLAPVASAQSSGFETAIAVSSSAADFAVEAIGGEGRVLGVSPAAPR
jgi:hypothetical protein